MGTVVVFTSSDQLNNVYSPLRFQCTQILLQPVGSLCMPPECIVACSIGFWGSVFFGGSASVHDWFCTFLKVLFSLLPCYVYSKFSSAECGVLPQKTAVEKHSLNTKT